MHAESAVCIYAALYTGSSSIAALTSQYQVILVKSDNWKLIYCYGSILHGHDGGEWRTGQKIVSMIITHCRPTHDTVRAFFHYFQSSSISFSLIIQYNTNFI